MRWRSESAFLWPESRPGAVGTWIHHTFSARLTAKAKAIDSAVSGVIQ